MADLPDESDDVAQRPDINEPAETGSGEGNQEVCAGSPECPICLQPCMHPVELPCRHVFCFLCIKGVAMQGPNSKCAICRATIPYSVLTNPQLKDISQLYKEPKSANGYQWYYESRSGGWWQYDERTMQDLERAFSSNQPSCQLLLAGHLYVVDFQQMIQYRLNNRSVSRRIRRGMNLEKRGVAGIRISGNNAGAGSSGGTNNQSPPPAAHNSAPSTRRRRGANASAPASGSTQTTTASSHHPNPDPSGRVSTTGPQASHSSAVSAPSLQDVAHISDSDDESEEDEDYDSDYSDVDDDMELGEEEEALIGEDSDERETEDEEEYEARDGARAPTRRSDRSNSSNNQTPPPPSGNVAHGTSGNGRTYSPNSNGRGSRGARSGRSSGGGRNGNGTNGATTRGAALGISDPSSVVSNQIQSSSSNSTVLSPLLLNRCNVEDVTKSNVTNNNNIYVDPQIQVSYAVSQTLSNISNNVSTVKVTFDRRNQLNQDDFL